MQSYQKIIKRLEDEELVEYATIILENLGLDELREYTKCRERGDKVSEDQIRLRAASEIGLPNKHTGHQSMEWKEARRNLVRFLSEHLDDFSEEWEQQHDTGDWMHPDEDDDEFSEHEAPDKEYD